MPPRLLFAAVALCTAIILNGCGSSSGISSTPAPTSRTTTTTEKPIQQKIGYYRLRRAVTVYAGASARSREVGSLERDETIMVVQVARMGDFIRGKIQQPTFGWVTLLNEASQYEFAEWQGETPPTPAPIMQKPGAYIARLAMKVTQDTSVFSTVVDTLFKGQHIDVVELIRSGRFIRGRIELPEFGWVSVVNEESGYVYCDWLEPNATTAIAAPTTPKLGNYSFRESSDVAFVDEVRQGPRDEASGAIYAARLSHEAAFVLAASATEASTTQRHGNDSFLDGISV